MGEPLCCAGGCGLLYSDPGWVDVHIPDKTWLKIAPRTDGGGVLCLTCITRRLEAAGIHDVPLRVCSPYVYRDAATARSLELVAEWLEATWVDHADLYPGDTMGEGIGNIVTALRSGAFAAWLKEREASGG